MSIIAHLHLSSPFILAPLAGYSDLPFRLLCRHFGAGLCFSEMISCHGLVYEQRKTLAMLASVPAERPVAYQLFGAEPAVMAKAADMLNRFSPDLVDINMGCPVKKVTKKGAGAALMAAPDLAAEIIREVVRCSEVPVTVKFRRGVNHRSLTYLDFAKMAEDCGAKALTLHGRTWSQGFTGKADWQCIAEVKKAVSVPVIGNGDVQSHQQAVMRRESSGCDGIMIGRGALGNPWIFGSAGRPQFNAEIAAGALLHLQLMEQYIAVDRFLAAIKNHMGRYFTGLAGSTVIRRRIYQCADFPELRACLESLASTAES